MLEQTLSQNKGKEAVQAKLFPILTKLKSWDKEQNIVKSNVTVFKLPKFE